MKWYTHNKTVPTTQASARYLFLGTAIETVGILGGFVDAHQEGTDAIDDNCALVCPVAVIYYGVSTISRLHKNIGLFCKRAL